MFQSCTGLNNIQYLRKEIEAVQEFFEFSSSDEGSDHFTVVTKTSSKMEGSVSCYMDSAIAKVSHVFKLCSYGWKLEFINLPLSLIIQNLSQFFCYIVFQLRPSLYGAVKASCDSGNEYHLLHEVLERELCVLRQRLDDTNFGAFMLKIWNALIAIFSRIVEVNSVVSNCYFVLKFYGS